MSEFVICEKDELVNVADAIRGKTGKSEEMTLDQMVTEIEGISGGGVDDSVLFNAINTNTLIDFVATESMTNFRPYMFYGNSALKTADLTKLQPELSNGKLDCNNMIGPYCFYDCSGLETIALPVVLGQIGTGNVIGYTWLCGRAFLNCKSLKDFCTDYKCNPTSATPNIFQGCTSLERAIIPNFTGNGYLSTFNGCSSLEIVDFSATVINASCFANCSKIKTIVLRTETMASLSNINAFTATPFAVGGTGGTVYVPQALIEQYQQATNWSTLYAAGTCNFVAIEGSEYE